MREPTIARDRERGKASVIDTLSAGYAIVNRHPWIIAVPVLLDLFFWLGPRLSLAPLVQGSLGRVQTPAGLAGDSGDMVQTYQELWDGLLRAVESFNLFSLLATNFPGIPSLMSAREGMGSTTTLADHWMALALFLLMPVVGIWLASAYYVAVGRQVRGGSEDAGELADRIWRAWRRLLGFVLLMLGLGLFFGLPLATLALLVGSASASLLGFLAAFLWVVVLWVQFYLFFVVEAIVISDVGPLQAMRNSVAVVKFNLGSTLLLIGVIWVVMLGMPVVWDALAQSTVGTMAGILGNAYISTGLAVASMIYYRDRFAALGPGGHVLAAEQ